MPNKQKNSVFKSSFKVVKHSLVVVRHHPEIATYPYAALLFTSLTYPIISATVFAHWYRRVFSDVNVVAPHKIGAYIGLIGFSAFYTALVTAYFTTATSASVLAKLEGLPVLPFYGVLRVAKNFFRVTRFALASVFFFPIGVYAQRRRLADNFVGVFGSSLTLHMAQVGPALLTTNKKLGATIRDAVDTLGDFWREGLVLKIGMYLLIFLIVALPKLVQKDLFKSHAASTVGWLISVELATSSLVTLKVINAIFTAVMYHEAKQKNT